MTKTDHMVEWVAGLSAIVAITFALVGWFGYADGKTFYFDTGLFAMVAAITFSFIAGQKSGWMKAAFVIGIVGYFVEAAASFSIAAKVWSIFW